MIALGPMKTDLNNKYSYKVGQKVKKYGEIKRITSAGEVIFSNGDWMYDYELYCESGKCKRHFPGCSVFIASDECKYL